MVETFFYSFVSEIPAYCSGDLSHSRLNDAGFLCQSCRSHACFLSRFRYALFQSCFHVRIKSSFLRDICHLTDDCCHITESHPPKQSVIKTTPTESRKSPSDHSSNGTTEQASTQSFIADFFVRHVGVRPKSICNSSVGGSTRPSSRWDSRSTRYTRFTNDFAVECPEDIQS